MKKTVKTLSYDGTGAGSLITNLAESAFCVVCSYMLINKKEPDLETIRVGNVNVETAMPFRRVIKFLKENPDWYYSIAASSERFIKHTNLPNRTKFHQSGRLFDAIGTEFYRLLKKINKKKLRVHHNKWNPGDVWLSNGVHRIPKFKTIDEYNLWLVEQFNNKKLISVSLKKTGKNPRIKIFGQTKPNPVGFKKIVKQPNPLNSKDVYIEATDGSRIQFRTFKPGTNIQCEVKGKRASHGKIGTGNINYFFNYYNADQIPDKKWVINNITNDTFITHLNMIMKTNMKVDKFDKFDNEDYIISKYQSVTAAAEIKKSDARDEIINSLVNYAKSSTGIAGLFEPSIHFKIY